MDVERLVLAGFLCWFCASITAQDLAPGTNSGLELDYDGETRLYDLYLPQGYDGTTNLPLVVDMHGAGQLPITQRVNSSFAQLADAQGFVVVYPLAVDQVWNSSLQSPGTADDVGFLRALVSAVSNQVSIDLGRVYATGFSSGGEMSSRLACDAADVFAAFAPVAGAFPAEFLDRCRPSRPVPILVFRGTNDPVIPYDGGVGATGVPTLSAAEEFDFWRRRSGCNEAPPDRIMNLGPTSDCQTFTMCSDQVEVGLCSVRGVDLFGHLIYGNEDDIDLAPIAWEFMSRYAIEVEAAPEFVINAGLTGAWFNPQMAGQGLLIEPIPDSSIFFAAWFTFDDESEKVGAPGQRWFTLQGPYEDATAEVQIFQVRGGVFDTAGAMEPEPVGTAVLRFSDCTTALFEYAFENGPEGSMTLERLTPDTLCNSSSGR